MSKLKVGVIFGGMSSEHDVSINSGLFIINKLDECRKKLEKDEVLDDISLIDNIINYLKNMDIIFPVLHGLYGEDGTIQGMLELMKIPYVGCNVLASSIGMDKVYSKIIFEKANINQAKYVYIKNIGKDYIYINKQLNEQKLSLDEICKIVTKNINFPLFVKPSNSGSSIGINKAHNMLELKQYIEEASNYDNKILIEENIDGKEVECAIIGNERVYASIIGEVLSAEEFYSYNAKYKNNESKIQIPANLSNSIQNEIKNIAIKAYKSIDAKGLSRVDFFVTDDGKIYINEINTMPGFTNISMYPILWENSGINNVNLLDNLISLAINDK